MKPILIGSEIYRIATFGEQHPLAIPRASAALDLIRALNAVEADNYRDSPMASLAELGVFHTSDYLGALQAGQENPALVSEAARERHRLGRDSNPFHSLMFSRPATACGGTLLAADLLSRGKARIIHNLGGGTHHGRPDRASGFCYLNDPVLGILRLLAHGFSRIAYVDLDAHHPDGVQDAFAGDRRVTVLSVHETQRWPRTGMTGDSGGGFARNVAVPPRFNDTEMGYVVESCLIPAVMRAEPEVLILQCGADALEEDPLSRLSLSNNALWDAVRALMPLADRVLALGGGGYNPWSVARCWAGVWLTLNGVKPPAVLAPEAQAVLRGLSWRRAAGRNPPAHWFTTLADPPRPGLVREEVRAAVTLAMK